jgi:hypothetical protein
VYKSLKADAEATKIAKGNGMSGRDTSYDPVTAADEANATGSIAGIFADIRAMMGLPLLTSIWRGLADMDDALPRVWSVAKPLYTTGGPERALDRVIERVNLPVPEPLTQTQLACVGMSEKDLAAAKMVIAAYNRSNGMNMVALPALTATPGKGTPFEEARKPVPDWATFPALLPRDRIAPDTWAMIESVNTFGSAGPDAFVATLWRHLAHWPGLLALAQAGFAPLGKSGTIKAATIKMAEIAQDEGERMASPRWHLEGVSDGVRQVIVDYAAQPTHVARMVTMGHALAKWLDAPAD